MQKRDIISVKVLTRKNWFSLRWLENKTHKIIDRLPPHCRKRRLILSIAIVGETRMESLNKKYRHGKTATDVLSFEGKNRFEPGDLGEVILCPAYLEAQAKRVKVPFKQEVLRMLTHGILHLCGYTHKAPLQKKKMFHLQEKIIKNI